MIKILEQLHEAFTGVGELYDYPVSKDTWVRVVYLDVDQYAYARQSYAKRERFSIDNLEQVAIYIADHVV